MAPETRAARNRSRPTSMPLNAAALGDCPAARIRSPVGVRAITYPVTTMISSATPKPQCTRVSGTSAGRS